MRLSALGSILATRGRLDEASEAYVGSERILADNPEPQAEFVHLELGALIALGRGDRAGQLATLRTLAELGVGTSDFFGFDSGAQIGLELRYGLWRGAQVGINRTSDRTIQFFTQYELAAEGRLPVGISAWGSIDGTDNFSDSYSPALGAVISRELGQHGALYAQPMWVNNSNPEPGELVDSNDTFFLGLGTRLRVLPTVYITAEFAPRLGGYSPGDALVSFGVEKRVGGHAFQINVSNSFGTTMAQIARGGFDDSDWYIGFNISRKFY